MRDINQCFREEYHFALKNVKYTRIDRPVGAERLTLNIVDHVDSSVQGDKLLASFTRKVFCEPSAIYELEVEFILTLIFKETISAEDRATIHWDEVLLHQENPYMSNIISRAVNLIASLTSAQGQQPLITPPRVAEIRV